LLLKKISYSQLFSFGQFQNETIGLEAELELGEDPKKAMRLLKLQVINMHDYNQRIRDLQIIIRQMQSQIDVDGYYLNDYVREELDAKAQTNYDYVIQRKMKNEEQMLELLEELKKLKEI